MIGFTDRPSVQKNHQRWQVLMKHFSFYQNIFYGKDRSSQAHCCCNNHYFAGKTAEDTWAPHMHWSIRQPEGNPPPVLPEHFFHLKSYSSSYAREVFGVIFSKFCQEPEPEKNHLHKNTDMGAVQSTKSLVTKPQSLTMPESHSSGT